MTATFKFDDSSKLSDRSIDDDFEVVSDVHLVEPVSIISEYGARGGDETERTVGNDRIHVIDPLSAFEMIHSEHRLLKDELETQNEMLRQRLEATEIQERRKTEEIQILKSDVEALSMELDEKKSQQSELELQIKYFKESSEKADLLAAQLLEAQDVIQSQHEMIQQLRGDGYGGAPTAPVAAPSTDDSLRAEIAQKNEQIKRIEGALAKYESSLGTMHAERLKAKNEAEQLADMNRELQEIVTAFQSQAEVDKARAEMDKAEWEVIRSDLEQQIQVLSDRVLAFENQYSSPSLNEPSQSPSNTNTTASRPESGTPTIRPRAQDNAPVFWKECERCHLPMARVGPHPCPAIVDGLD